MEIEGTGINVSRFFLCDNDGVVDWCVVLVEMPLTRFEECWLFPTESLPELP